jgi:GT2 family glycosyltransferase
MKKISAITVNYARDESVHKLIDSLEKSIIEGFTLDVVVVDNAPVKPFKKLRDYKLNVTVIRPGQNCGFSGGNNIGIKAALKNGADYLLLVNDDTTVLPDMVKNLKGVLESDESIGVASPKIYFAKGHEFHKKRYTSDQLGRVFWFAGGHTDWAHAKSVHRGVDEVDNGQYEKTEEIDFATGCCMMIKKEVLEKTGLFDEKYFLYYEDDDLCQRIKRSGYKIYYVPTAAMYHENASSSGGAGNVLHDYFLTRNQMLFGMKYAPLRTKIALIKQSLILITTGRAYQKKGIKDYYLGRYGKGTFFSK